MLNIFKLFKNKKQNVFSSGALIDIRSDEEKVKDYKFDELTTSASPVNWVDKPSNTWRKFPIFNQDGSNSCVSQTMAKILGILYWLDNNKYIRFSATHIYQRRKNKPTPGMSGVDVFKIAQKGTTLEILVPSQNMNDSQMDNTKIAEYKKEVGEVFKIGNYIILPNCDIESVASVIQVTGKPVMVWFFFRREEWNYDVPIIKDTKLKANEPGIGRHSVTAIDFTLYKGKKSLIIEDSWGTYGSFKGQRIITEDFFSKRNFFAAYTMNFRFDEKNEESNKPKYVFNVDLEYGQRNNDIKILQDILKYEGLFPLNISSTGYYGSITTKAVQDFQIKYKIAGKNIPGFGRVGPKTRKKLNELYN